MLYDKTFEVEERLKALLLIVKKGGSSAPSIADQLGVSVPTVSRSISVLRRRGFDIRSEKHGHSWRYTIDENKGIGKSLVNRSRASE